MKNFKFIKYIIPVLFEYMICAAICWIMYSLFLAEDLDFQLGYMQWFAIIVIATAILPNNLKPSNRDDK